VLSSHDHNSSAMRYLAVSNMACDRFKESGGLAEHQSHPMLDKQFRLLMTDNPAVFGQSAVLEITGIPNAPSYAVEVAHGGFGGPDDHMLHAFPADRGAGIIEPAAVSPGHCATSVERPNLRPEPADRSRATEPATGSCRWSRTEPAGPSRWARGQAQPLGWDSARPRQAHDGAGGDGDSC
jgi:hypothetical protein